MSEQKTYEVSYEFLHQMWQAVGGVPQGVDSIQRGCYEKCRDAYIALNRLFDKQIDESLRQRLAGEAVKELAQNIQRLYVPINSVNQRAEIQADIGRIIAIALEPLTEKASTYRKDPYWRRGEELDVELARWIPKERG